jgi:chitodextrinase
VSAVGPVLWNASKYSNQVFYAGNIKGGVDTVTATFASAVTAFGIVYIHEYSGVDQTTPVDVITSALGTSGSLDSGSVNTPNANDLLFGAGVSMNTVTHAGTLYNARSIAQGNITEDSTVSATGSYNATATNSSGGWAMQMVAFRGASTNPPTVPTGVTATPLSSSQISVSWNASTDPDNTPAQLSYGVYRGGSRIATTAAGATSWQDTGLRASTTFTYTASAQDPAGNSSAQSASAQASTSPLTPSITTFTANPVAISAGQTTTLLWTVSNTTSLAINNGVGTVTSLNSITVSPAATTTYILTASNGTASSTAQVAVTVSAPDKTPPSVRNPAAVAISSSQVNLSWPASTDNVGVAGYQVYRNGAQLAPTTATTYSDTGLSANTTYSYTVSAL